MGAMPIKNSKYFTFVRNLILKKHILILHIIVVPDAHSGDADRQNLIDRKLKDNLIFFLLTLLFLQLIILFSK